MKGAHSISTRRAYGVQRVCRVWHRARSSVYARRPHPAHHVPLRAWLDKAVAPPLVRRHGISPAIAAELAMLPDSFHRDPADRILVATRRC